MINEYEQYSKDYEMYLFYYEFQKNLILNDSTLSKEECHNKLEVLDSLMKLRAEEIHDYNIRLIHGKQTRNNYFVNWFENKVILELEPFDLPWEK